MNDEQHSIMASYKTPLKTMPQAPSWLSITKVGEQHYQLTDTSVESIGLCLGVFHCREAAQSFADKIARTRVVKPADGERTTLRLGSLKRSPNNVMHSGHA